MDFYDSKCHLKKYKDNECTNNPEKCAMNCHKNVLNSISNLSSIKNIDNNISTNIPKISDGINRIKNAQKYFCSKIPDRFNEAASMRVNEPTKRRNIINW